MNVATKVLVEQVQKVYADRPDLLGLFDEEAIELLALTPNEVKVLAALLLHEGIVYAAWDTCYNLGFREETFYAALKSLEGREMPFFTDEAGVERLNIDAAVRALRMQFPEEVETPEGEPPSVKLVLRPLRERAVMLAREGKTPAAGLSKVYHLVFGQKAQDDDFAMLGLLGKVLGRDQAALLLLDHATTESPTLLHDLVPLARAKAAGFRPKDAPKETDQDRYDRALHQQAREQRRRLGLEG